mmetsp:Transcript_9936/g.24857  ORF Transcript_9936/g.24857 Transcript_9936/m.24857 type:complete len:271 (+) Transcript_9936:980-1792(+)
MQCSRQWLQRRRTRPQQQPRAAKRPRHRQWRRRQPAHQLHQQSPRRWQGRWPPRWRTQQRAATSWPLSLAPYLSLAHTCPLCRLAPWVCRWTCPRPAWCVHPSSEARAQARTGTRSVHATARRRRTPTCLRLRWSRSGCGTTRRCPSCARWRTPTRRARTRSWRRGGRPPRSSSVCSRCSATWARSSRSWRCGRPPSAPTWRLLTRPRRSARSGWPPSTRCARSWARWRRRTRRARPSRPWLTRHTRLRWVSWAWALRWTRVRPWLPPWP